MPELHISEILTPSAGVTLLQPELVITAIFNYSTYPSANLTLQSPASQPQFS